MFSKYNILCSKCLAENLVVIKCFWEFSRISIYKDLVVWGLFGPYIKALRQDVQTQLDYSFPLIKDESYLAQLKNIDS